MVSFAASVAETGMRAGSSRKLSVGDGRGVVTLRATKLALLAAG
jgi:hypothetical protein